MAPAYVRSETELRQQASNFRRIITAGVFGNSGPVHKALDRPLVVPGYGTVELHQYQYNPVDFDALAVSTIPALNLVDREGLPVTFAYLDSQSRTQVAMSAHAKSAILRAWAERKLSINSNGALLVQEFHDHLDEIDGTVPIYDDNGNEITEDIANRTKRSDILEHVRWLYNNIDEQVTRILSTRYDSALAALEAASGQKRAAAMDRLNEVASTVRSWLLDDPNGTGALPHHSEQKTAINLLEKRRQSGLQSIRTASSETPVLASAEALVKGVGIESGPTWARGSTNITGTAPFTGASVPMVYAAPTSGQFVAFLTATNPTTSYPSADVGSVTVDTEEEPGGGWVVSQSTTGGVVTVRMTWTSETAPSAGSYRFSFTARNLLGPSRVTMTITVA